MSCKKALKILYVIRQFIGWTFLICAPLFSLINVELKKSIYGYFMLTGTGIILIAGESIKEIELLGFLKLSIKSKIKEAKEILKKIKQNKESLHHVAISNFNLEFKSALNNMNLYNDLKNIYREFKEKSEFLYEIGCQRKQIDRMLKDNYLIISTRLVNIIVGKLRDVLRDKNNLEEVPTLNIINTIHSKREILGVNYLSAIEEAVLSSSDLEQNEKDQVLESEEYNLCSQILSSIN